MHVSRSTKFKQRSRFDTLAEHVNDQLCRCCYHAGFNRKSSCEMKVRSGYVCVETRAAGGQLNSLFISCTTSFTFSFYFSMILIYYSDQNVQPPQKLSINPILIPCLNVHTSRGGPYTTQPKSHKCVTHNLPLLDISGMVVGMTISHPDRAS